jgi:hypothetical protein
MRYFTSVRDIKSVDTLVQEALNIKKNPYIFPIWVKIKPLACCF